LISFFSLLEKSLVIYRPRYAIKTRDGESFIVGEGTAKLLENPEVPENAWICIGTKKRIKKWTVVDIELVETTEAQVARAKHDAYLREVAAPRKLSPEEKKKREEKIRLLRQELINKGIIEDPSV
jgi:hypothetical protein